MSAFSLGSPCCRVDIVGVRRALSGSRLGRHAQVAQQNKWQDTVQFGRPVLGIQSERDICGTVAEIELCSEPRSVDLGTEQHMEIEQSLIAIERATSVDGLVGLLVEVFC